ncbi:MAG: carboxymuconolactone decarboxylase family protein [Candidatus Tectimicrobiota bacterium]
MARIPTATRDSVPANQREMFDTIVQKQGSVPLYGPGSVMIHVPQASHWATGLNNYLRDESSLPKKVQELAMLVTARELDCQHIWNAHAASARQAGVPDEVVDGLREYEALADLAPDEAAVVQYGREFFRTHRVSRGAFQQALEQFGKQGVVELALIFGNYSMLAVLINSFDTDLPPNRNEPLLPVESL